MTRGIFITVEGVEGSGKSTQASLLAAYLGESGFTVTETREPGGTDIGEIVRRILLAPSNTEISPETEMFLYMGCRADHVDRLIRPALERGDVVLSDRYADATVAYQGYARGLDLEWIDRLNKVAANNVFPDITVLLDLDPQVGLSRVAVRSDESGTDRFEREKLSFHKRVREGYRAIAAAEPDRVKVVEADADAHVVQEKVQAIIREFLSTTKSLARSI